MGDCNYTARHHANHISQNNTDPTGPQLEGYDQVSCVRSIFTCLLAALCVCALPGGNAVADEFQLPDSAPPISRLPPPGSFSEASAQPAAGAATSGYAGLPANNTPTNNTPTNNTPTNNAAGNTAGGNYSGTGAYGGYDAFISQGEPEQQKLGEVYINSGSLQPFTAGAGTFASQVGVIHTGYTPPSLITARAEIGGTVGTHTHLGDIEAGLAGVVPLRWSYFDYNIGQTFGVLSRQWSYDYPGIEYATSAEGTWRLPLDPQETRQIGLGWRGQWFNNRSWDEVQGRTPSFERNFSAMQQRVGTYFVQYDWKQAGDFQRLRVEFGNDAAMTGGTGEDEYRTAQTRVSYLRQTGNLQYRIGGVMELFTGHVDQNRTTTTGDGEFYVRDGLDFENWSQGFLGVELGMSWFHKINHFMTGELGFNLYMGPDTEDLRNLLQNQVTHEPQGIPQVPVVPREDRFRFDVRLFYVIHFGAN